MLKEFLRSVVDTGSGKTAGTRSIPSLMTLYQQQVAKKHLWHDPEQAAVIDQLQSLLEQVIRLADFDKQSSIKKLLSANRETGTSLYLYGGVGRGKSMLMDLFFYACPIQAKRRVHFHAFMLEVHEFAHHWRQNQSGDPIPALAKKIRLETLLFCFDEFHVTDITDAMILGRLFNELFASGIIMVATSNRHPDDLYKGGLQRDRFVPFIDLLKEKAQIVKLAVKQDYRLAHLHALATTYYSPIDDNADQFLLGSYHEFTNFAPIEPGVLTVLGRTISLSAVHGDVALASFKDLCEEPLGAADYLEIAFEFSTILISNIPRLSREQRNEAKRFVTLIDALYEHKVKLICTAEVPPEQLYTEGDGTFEFERTVSRLIEMQSENYLSSGHR